MLTEKYRPRSFDQVIGQDRIIRSLTQLQSRSGLSGRAYWISGKSGQGKTTIARIIASTVAGQLAIEEMNAADVDLDFVRDMERRWTTTVLARPGEPHGRAFIFNEGHLLRKPIVSRLLTTLEEIPQHCAVIFTTTQEGKALFEDYGDGHPLVSRCFPVPLSKEPGGARCAEYLQRIAQQEGMDGQPVAKYVRLFADCSSSFRLALQRIEAGEMAS